MTSQQPPEGLSAEDVALEDIARERGWRGLNRTRDTAGLAARAYKSISAGLAARSTSPAPDPKAGAVLVARELVEETADMLRGLSNDAMNAKWANWHDSYEQALALEQALVMAVMQPTPAKAGEREQVAEAVARMERVAADPLVVGSGENGVPRLQLAADASTILSAMAEARSEVERQAMTIAALEGNLERAEAYGAEQKAAVGAEMDAWLAERNARLAAEAERDTLAAQLAGAREEVEALRGAASWVLPNLIEGEADANIVKRVAFLNQDIARFAARQALSMSILRGDKGCSLGAIEAPSCGSPADSQTSGGAESAHSTKENQQ